MSKSCTYCQKDVADDAVKCKHCGGWFSNDAEIKQQAIDRENLVEKHLTPKEDKAGTDVGSSTQYFYVPKNKLIFLFLASGGLYEIYWFYKNWKMVKNQEGIKIMPFWRAVFSILFCFSFFKRVVTSAKFAGYQGKVSAGNLAAVYIIFSIFYKLPDPYWLICFLSIIPLIKISEIIGYSNAKIDSSFTGEHRMNTPEIILLVVGILLWVLIILGFIFPEEPFPLE